MQLSLFYDYQTILDSNSFIRKYDALFQAVEIVLDKPGNSKAGRKGYGFSAFVKALVYKHAQQIKSVPELIRDLESRPLISEMCGFPYGKLPDESRFYEFLSKTKTSKIQDMMHTSEKLLTDNGIASLDMVIADSKPIKANTKHNNQKNPNRSLDKNHKIKRNPKATLGYYSYIKQPTNGSKKFTFFWGYRTHVLISREGIPLIEITRPNNFSDEKAAKMMLKKFIRVYGQRKDRIFIRDSAYDFKHLYKFIVKQMKSKAYIPINPRNAKPERYFSRLGDREAEQTTHYNYRAIRNQMSIAHLTMSLTAVAAAIILERKDKIRSFRTFAEAA